MPYGASGPTKPSLPPSGTLVMLGPNLINYTKAYIEKEMLNYVLEIVASEMFKI